MQGKINNALKFLKDGLSYKIDNLRLDAANESVLQVIGWSQCLNFKNITKQNSLSDLKVIKGSFVEMLESYEDLRSFVEGKLIQYTLCYDDAGKGSVIICWEINDILNWNIDDLKESA